MIADRYRVIRFIAKGGMGQVYEVDDLELKARVALKTIAPERASSPRQVNRFRQEIQLARTVSHPNVCRVFDLGRHRDEKHGEVLFLTMELLPGETLSARLREQGAMPCNEALPLIRQMVSALAAAHELGIVHRDFKPGNVMLLPAGTGPSLKITDFGLATNPETQETVSGSHPEVVGTPDYMPPEQFRGQCNARTDVYALGVTVFQMVTGELPTNYETPFRPGTAGGRASGVRASASAARPQTGSSRAPSGVSTTSKRIPQRWREAITKAMALNAAARYESVEEFWSALSGERLGYSVPKAIVESIRRHRWIYAGGAAVVIAAIALFVAGVIPSPLRPTPGQKAPALSQSLPQVPVLAVLPFKAIAGDEKLTALGQGVVESVAAKLGPLSENHALEIIPASNLQERGVTSLAEARKQFGANVGLAVTLERSGELVRLSYSLLNAETGAVIGGDSLTVPAADVFSVQDDIAAGAVKALRLKLQPEEQAALKIHGTSNPGAYSYYLQARGYLLNFARAENVDNAILMLNEALKLDPNFGTAEAALGEAYWRRYWLTKDKQWTILARQECNKAVALGNAGAAGHSCLGLIADGSGQYREAITEYQQALELEPGSETAFLGLALAYEHQGAITEAEQTYQRAIESHPNSPYTYNSLGTFYLRREQYAKAVQMFQKVIALAPEGHAAYVNLGATYVNMDRNADAIEPLKKSIAIRPTVAAYVNLGAAYFGLNRFADEAAAYEEAIKLDPKEYVTWGNLAEARYYTGNKSAAMDAYHKAIELAGEELKVNPHDPDVLSNLANYYSVTGQRNEALFYLQQALQYGHNDKEILVDAASVYNHLGETGLAVEWLAKAVGAGYPASRVASNPEFKNLENNPGYRQITGRARASR
jgi:serine/threonine protein kinase/tetratricopeptide (TPR) repeat protein